MDYWGEITPKNGDTNLLRTGRGPPCSWLLSQDSEFSSWKWSRYSEYSNSYVRLPQCNWEFLCVFFLKNGCSIFAGRSSTFGGMLSCTWPPKMGHTVDGKTPAPLRMPEMLVLSQYQDVFGHPKWCRIFSTNRISTFEESSVLGELMWGINRL